MAKPVLTDLDFGGVARATGLPNPASGSDVATKAYVDAAAAGRRSWKDSARVLTSTNANLAAPGTSLDGVTMAANDRFVANGQSSPSANGIYVWNGASTPATRAADADTFDELEMAFITIEEGSAAGVTYRQTAINGTLGSTAISFTTFSTAAAPASETVSGIAEIATQAEVDAGTDDVRFVTPLKMASYAGRIRKVAANIGDNSATSFNIDHNLGSRDVTVTLMNNSGNYDDVLADVTRPTVNRVTITFKAAPAANAYRVVVTG